jgi:hypothetical protein
MNLADLNSKFVFDSTCVRQKSNWSKTSDKYKFENENFDAAALLSDIELRSPKIEALMNKIKDLDKQDMQRDGVLYKHFIFSDLKSSSYGAKLLASVFIANGINIGYVARKKGEISPPKIVSLSKTRKSSKSSTKSKSKSSTKSNKSVSPYSGPILTPRSNDNRSATPPSIPSLEYIAPTPTSIPNFTPTPSPSTLEEPAPNFVSPTPSFGVSPGSVESIPSSASPTPSFGVSPGSVESIPEVATPSPSTLEEPTPSFGVSPGSVESIPSSPNVATPTLEEPAPSPGIIDSVSKSITDFISPTPSLSPETQQLFKDLEKNGITFSETPTPEEITKAKTEIAVKKQSMTDEEYEKIMTEFDQFIETKKTGGGNSDDEDEDEDEDDFKEGIQKKKPKTKIWGKPRLLSDNELLQTENNNFYLLSSVGVYDQPINVVTKKAILKKFNERPDNIHGEQVRFIIMDSGFKEGIDLFDIKYVHIFEPSTVASDQKQVIGRGTRTCGQKGLIFHPTQGWPLHVFIYDLEIPESIKSGFNNASSTFDLYLKSLNIDLRIMNFASDLEEQTIYGSVDYTLNKNIHNFAVQTTSGGVGTPIRGNLVKLGKGKKVKSLKSLPVVKLGKGKKVKSLKALDIHSIIPSMIPSPVDRFNHSEMREYINRNYQDFEWTDIKMENLCGPPPTRPIKQLTSPLIGGSNNNIVGETAAMYNGLYPDSKSGGASTVIKLSPTQDFVKHFFTPQNPCKGMLLWHSVGTGKTCSAIAAASTTFEQQGYTILWVTRTTLKNDIWKNMFDQVCSERIRGILERNPEGIPEEQNKRMRMLSQSWKIRPMSYKTFSNLVSQQNEYYKTLVKINGAVDPLRKTLIIIDEAHKLYGGGDLSSLERPDMKKLHAALMKSYAVSGTDSCKLLLMTATPITQDPMELIKLVNLCKPIDEQMADEFYAFASQYLNEEGRFYPDGRRRYLDNIAGYISYLNREKDARQFSQPRIQYITPNIIKNPEDVYNLDNRFVREYMASDIGELKKVIETENKGLEGDLGDLDMSKFGFLKNHCNGYEGKAKKKCIKIVNSHIKNLLEETKIEAAKIKDKIKEIRNEIKIKGETKKDVLSKLAENLEKNPETFSDFKNTNYYNIKYNCGKKIATSVASQLEAEDNDEIIELDGEMELFDQRIRDKKLELKIGVEAYNMRIKEMQKLLKTNISAEEKTVLRMNILDQRKTLKNISKVNSKVINKQVGEFKSAKTGLAKQKKTMIKNLKKSFMKRDKQIAKEALKESRHIRKEEKKLRKTMRKQGEYEEITNTNINLLVAKYNKEIQEGIESIKEELDAQNALDEEKYRLKMEKAAEKAEKKQQKDQEKQQKVADKQMKDQLKGQEKQQKIADKQVKDQLKGQEKLQKEQQKQQKLAEKEQQKLLKQTMKLSKPKIEKVRKTIKLQPPMNNVFG